MDDDVRVKLENVSKKFCRSLKRSLWYGVKDLGAELLGHGAETRGLRAKEFWSVRNVSFSVRKAETVGVIGPNGAGKTTLLRMIHGLIKPDGGRIFVRGHMQALIALGAGFNPILTGRENIYVNAAVLGISKKEVRQKFDKIVEFSGIEEFIDAPVQNYSSGMRVRLGFSVAAHMNPDILLVDEVLAVGDLEFQVRCRQRIMELVNNQVAVIVVSHQMHAISHLCSRVIVLKSGEVAFDGDTESAIDAYRNMMQGDEKENLQVGTGEVVLRRLELFDANGREKTAVEIGEALTFRLHYECVEQMENVGFNICIRNMEGDQVTGIRSDVDDVTCQVQCGEGFVDLLIPHFNLLPGAFTVDAAVFRPGGFVLVSKIKRAMKIQVLGGHKIHGWVYLPHSWGFKTGPGAGEYGAHRKSRVE